MINNSRKGFSNLLIISIVVVALILGGVIYKTNHLKFRDNEKEWGNKTMDKDDGAMMEHKEEATETNLAAKEYVGQILAGNEKSPLLDFNMADYKKALSENKLVLLYFYASWCPICKDEVKNSLYPFFNENMNSELLGFRVNFNDSDTDKNEEDLAREFGVAYQHTKVIVSGGKKALKSPEGWNKERYQAETSKLLKTTIN